MKKTIKKIAAVLFAVVIAVACFAGCSKSGGEHDKANDSKKAKFGIVVQTGANGAFVDMKDGIIEEMKKNGYENAEFDY